MFALSIAQSMLVPLPDGVDPTAAASAGDNFPLAVERIVKHLDARQRARVLVLGLGSIDLYSVQIARSLGTDVVYVDDDEQHRAGRHIRCPRRG